MRIFVLVLASVVASHGHAFDKDHRYMEHYAADANSCAALTVAVENGKNYADWNNWNVIAAWIQGYISGYNTFADNSVKDIAINTTFAQRMTRLENYCKKYPEESLGAAARTLISGLEEAHFSGT